MINTVQDIQDEFLVRGNYATSAAFITDAILNDWTRQAHRFCANYKKWPFTEGRVSTTFTTGVGNDSDEWNFEGYRADSFRIVQVGGKRLRKLNFADYQIFREEQPQNSDRVFSDFGNTVFINPRIDVSGTLTAWGQYMPNLDPTDKTATTVFSGNAEDANEALVNEMLNYVKTREKKPGEAKFYHELVVSILDRIWQEVENEQAMYQPHPTRGGMWERVDIIEGSYWDDTVKRNQF